MTESSSQSQAPRENGGNSAQYGRKRAWLRLSLFALFFGVVLFAIYEFGWIEVFLDQKRAQRFLESLGIWKFLGFILLQVIQVIFAPIPGEATGVLGGYLFGVFWGIVLSTIGLTIGSMAAFWLSRIFGRPLVEKVVDRSVLDRFDYLVRHRGVFLIFILFLIPGFPKDYLCFILGIGHLSWLEFFAVSSLGRLMGTTMLTLSGKYFRYHQYENLFILLGAGIVFTILAYVFRERIENCLKKIQPKD